MYLAKQFLKTEKETKKKKLFFFKSQKICWKKLKTPNNSHTTHFKFKN